MNGWRWPVITCNDWLTDWLSAGEMRMQPQLSILLRQIQAAAVEAASGLVTHSLTRY